MPPDRKKPSALNNEHRLSELLNAHRLFVILGPYGSGKTEVAVNLAQRLAAMGRKTALADLDIVNPYFRSREKVQLLEEAGIRLIAPPQNTWAADLPAVPAALWTIIQDETLTGVLDVGGDKGAIVLAAFSKALNKTRPAVWYVLNQARLSAQTPEEAARQLTFIEAQAKLPVMGLISNTHLLSETTKSLVEEGAAFARQVSAITQLPLVCHGVQSALSHLSFSEPILPLTLVMKRPWE
jgi:hypothetical protein